jgi:hypothetical protein
MDGIAAFDKYAEDYDRWFEKNGPLYRAEIEAIKRFVPDMGFGVEIGTGTGRFSVPFGIRIGVEPSKNMGLPGSGATEYEVREGYGEGAFVAVSSEKTAKKQFVWL